MTGHLGHPYRHPGGVAVMLSAWRCLLRCAAQGVIVDDVAGVAAALSAALG